MGTATEAPIVYQELDLRAQMLELERRAERGADRCAIVFHPEDKDGLPAFPERYTRIADRFAD